MKIDFVLPYLADHFGGPVTVAKRTGQTLAGMGHSVSYWATASNGDGRELATTTDAHLFDTDWPHAWRRSVALRQALCRAIPQTHVLHIQSIWMYPSYAAGRIAHRTNIPYVICPAGTLQPWALQNGWLKRLKKGAYLHLIVRSLLTQASCVQAASVREAEQVRRLGHTGPVTVIPNGVDVDGLDRGDRDVAEMYWPVLRNRPVVAFMSRLSPEKGLDLLIPAWSEVIRSPGCRDALLVIAGPDFRGYENTVKAVIDKHDLASSIVMLGMVQGVRKSSLLKRADVFILPSYSENFGIVVAEALACGTPVITTTGTPWEQVQAVDAGRQVEPTKEAIGDALRELLAMSQSRRKQMGERGANLVREHYTWDQAARKFLTVCDCILGGRPIPLDPEPKKVRVT